VLGFVLERVIGPMLAAEFQKGMAMTKGALEAG